MTFHFVYERNELESPGLRFLLFRSLEIRSCHAIEKRLPEAINCDLSGDFDEIVCDGRGSDCGIIHSKQAL